MEINEIVESGLNVLGLVFIIIGSVISYKNTSKVSSHVVLYTSKEMESISARDRMKNRRLKFGFVFLLIGMLIQFVALYVKFKFL